MIENNLKLLREELDITQEELGNSLGVSNYTISGWENSHDIIPFDRLLFFCNKYGFSLDYALGLDNKSKWCNIKVNENDIPQLLRNFRKKQNLTQLKFTEKCNLSRSTYAGYENGDYLISTLAIYSISKAFNVSIDYLLGRKNRIL